MRFISSKHIIASSVVLIIAVPLVWAGVSSIKVANPPPAFENSLGEPTEPSDGGLDKSNPLNFGDTVTFTALATDPNGDSYYLALCRTDSITPKKSAKPVCNDGEWGISELTKSGEQASLTYIVGKDAKLKSEWFAFVCDNVADDSNCSKASQGSGDNGSPFYVSKQVGALRFGADCPDIKDIQDINAPQGATEPLSASNILNKELSKKEIRDLISSELLKKGDEELSPELKIIKDRVDALKAIEKDKGAVSDAEINAVADYFSARQAKLKNLAAHNVGFCVTRTTDDSIQNITGETGKTAKPQTQYKIGNEALKLDFKTDEERSISMEFRQTKGQKKPDPADIKGPEITYNDPDQKNKFLNPTDFAKKQAEATSETPDIFQTVIMKHETYVPSTPEPGFFEKLFGVGQTEQPLTPVEPPKQVSYDLSSLDTEKTDGVTVDEAVYQSSDNRKTDIYQYRNDPTSVVSNEIKNYTIYHYGNGDETELYSFDKAVLRMRNNGVIEGYYMENIDLSKEEGADQVDQDLLARAARTMQYEHIKDLHNNGGPQPDFTIPAPIAVDSAGNVIDNLTYEITGDSFNQLKISFTADANAYPIVLDPTLQFTAPGSSNLNDTITGQSSSNFGASPIAGDFNADGKMDLAVGAPNYNSSDGRVYIFYNDGTTPTTAATADVIITGATSTGGRFGVALASGDFNSDGKTDLLVGAKDISKAYIFYNDGSIPTSASSADVIIIGDSSTYFGNALTAGDFNADGRVDLVIGAWGASSSAGKAYIFYNDGTVNFGNTTCSGTPALCYASNADITITGETSSEFGMRLASGDINADGKTDLVVGGEGYSSGQGRAYVFYNDGSYPANANGGGTCTPDCADVIITGDAGTYFGDDLVTGDFNADGKTDLAVGAWNYSSGTGRTYIFINGSSSFPSCTTSCTVGSNANVTITGETGSYFGSYLNAGDFNADGKTDLAVGAPTYSSGGRAYIFYNDGSIPTTAAAADVIITGQSSSYFGQLASGDFNADGTVDLAVGAISYGSTYGRTYIFYGVGGALLRNTITGEASSYMGNAMTAGDFNADGKTDLAVTAYPYSSNTGRAYIFYNDGNISSTAASADVIITGEASSNLFGISIASGDLNSDGKTDIVVGASWASSYAGKAYIFYNDGSYPSGAGSADVIITGEASSYFGQNLTTGDLNSDGKTDLIVGAFGYNSGTGRVYIFINGSSSYPSCGSSCTAASNANIKIDGETSSNYFGYSLVTGDFNADGRIDLAAGAYFYSSSKGRAYIFYNDGSIPTSASSSDVIITGEAAGNGFSLPLAAGDLNSDGRTDLITGAYSYSSSTGRAYIFYADGTNNFGTTTCSGTPALCDAGYADVIITGEASSNFGLAIATGDLDSDGRTDLIVGGPYYNETDVGRAYIFYNDGSIPTTAATADIIITGDSYGDLGISLLTGDFNTDGINDLAVGAYLASSSAGRAYIFYGENKFAWNTKYPWRYENSSTFNLGSSLQIEGWANSEKFGSSLAVGDFNGDGAKDLAVGAPGYDSNRGAVYLFLQQGNYPMNDYNASVKITGDAIGDEFGYALASGRIGQTADAIDDLVIGAPGANTNQGYVYIFDGRTSWSSTYTASNNTNRMTDSAANSRCGTAIVAGYDFIGDAEKDFVYSCPGSLGNNGYYIDVCNNDGTYPTDSACETRLPTTTANKGFSLAAGNLNSDVYTDLVLGDPFTSSSTGAVYIYYGDTNRSTGITTSGSTTISGESSGNQFGYSLAVGELSDTRDNKDDVVASAPYYNSNQGKVYIFYNDGSYPASAGSAEKSFTGTWTYKYGQGLAIGDINRDGRKDLLISEPAYGSTNVGAIYGLYNTGSMASYDTELMPDIGSNSYFGTSILAADLDGNGWDDLIGGAYGYNTNKGMVIINDLNSYRFTSSDANYGSGLAIGDFNGDGYKDFAIGASGYNSNQGRVYIFLKYPQEMSKSLYPSPDVTITGHATGDLFGYSLSAGKVSDTQDTIDDLIIGAPGYDPVIAFTPYTDAGGVYEFDGRTSWSASYADADTSATNIIKYPSASSACGTSALVGRFANKGQMSGGINIGGREHLAYGCPGYLSNQGIVLFVWNDGSLGSQGWTGYDDYLYYSSGGTGNFGYSLAAGDFNNDGTVDIAVGAPIIFSNNGGVFISFNNGSYQTENVYIGGQTSSKFGTALTAGDFNGDGKTDLAAGAPLYNSNNGRTYIFNGPITSTRYTTGSPPSGPDTTIDGTFNYYLGQALAAGDINNDSKTDLVIGEDSNAYVFYNDGYIPTPTTNYYYDIRYGYLFSTYTTMPRRIAIGDLNSDGKPDILTSAPYQPAVNYMPSVSAQCEPSYITSAVISGTSGYTNSTTPTINLYYTNTTGSPIVPTQAYLSCDGIHWGSPVTVSGSSSPVTENTFDITSPTPMGCTTANESKTIYARLNTSCGVRIGYSASGSINYDNTPPTISGFTASVVSADQISLDPTASDSGSGMHATPYWYTETPGASCSHTNTYGWTATDPYTWGSLSANTQYSFDVKARDLLTNESSYSTCRTLYSGAYTPSAPTLTEPTSSTVKVNPVSGGTPAEKDMAIYESNSDSNCYNGTGGQYVQADGSLGGSPVWQADGSWGTGGTITVTGLTSGNTYYFCAKARNNDNVETVFGARSSVLLNSAPTFLEGPSDNGSSETSPTTAGNDVTFSAKSSDPDSNNYYLAICKTDSITPHDNAPPTCAPSQTWVISGETIYGNTASVAYTTSSGNASTNVWYAFLCDKVTGSLCTSPGNQGSGNNGSPFVVNHQAVLGTVKIGAECGDTAPTGPGNSKTMMITNGMLTSGDSGYGSAIQSDGKIVVVGASNNGTNYDFAVVRYLANGSLDTSFGAGGKVTTPIGSGNDTALSVAIQSDDKIVVAGYSNNGSNDDIAVVRYTAAGALDTGFSSDGIVTTPIGAGTDWAYSVLIQSDDKIVVAGFSNNGSNDDIAVVRYTAAGALDTDFSSDGIVTTDIGGDLDRGLEAAIQSDGKIVVGGVSKSGSYTDFAVVRYNTNGTLDTDFDGDVGMPGYPGNGKVTTDIASDDDSASEIGIQNDGKIVLGGSTSNGSDFDFAAVRYNSNGSLDTSFDTDGKVTTPIGTSHDQSTTLAIQNDGKIVLGGGSYNGGYYDFALVRYNSNGTLDSNFDSDGKVTTQLSATTDSISYIRLQTDGKIVAAGYTSFGSNTDFAVVRYNINGSLDATFEHDGKVTSQVWSPGDDGRASAIQSDGKLVVAGYTSNGTNNDFAVARYNVDGSLDTSFSDDGLVTTPVLSSNDEAYAVAIQSDGKIVVGGTTDNGGNNDFAVVRYNANGSLDTDFDTDGIVTTPVGTGYDWLGDIAIQSDGKIVAAGSATSSGNMDIAVVRYNTDGSLDTTFSGDGKVTTAIGSGLDGGESVAIQSDGKIVVAGEASMPVSGDDFAVIRYNTDGSLDDTFDGDTSMPGYPGNGKVTTTIGVSSDQGKDVAIQSDGKIVVAGWYYSGPTNYGDTAVVRYNTNGSLDTSFDSDGKATTTIFSGKDDFGYSVVIQSDGKIVVAGETDRISGSGRDFSLVRFTSAGALDTTFDSDGKVTTSVGSGLDQCRSIAIQSDGRIVAVGRTNVSGSNYDIAVVRYNTDGSIDSPSGYACAQAGVTDSDSDTVNIYVCSTNVFSSGCESGKTLCTITGVRSGFSGQCIMNGSVPVPTAHGSYNAYVFIVDQHGYQGSGTSTQTYSVADVAPALTSYTVTHSPTPAAGGSDTINYYLDLSDANGYADVTNVKGVFFDSSSVNNYCTLNDNNCYIHSSCTPSNQSGASLRATCQSTVWFNSNASTVWKVQAKPTTDLGVSDLPNLSDANNITIPPLQGIDIVQSSIGYGTIAIGGTSVAIETSMGNAGNQGIDVKVDGDNMCIDSYQPTCPTSDYVPLGQQKWYHTSDPFDWDDPPTGPGPYTLIDTASGTGDATGCLNRNIYVRSDHASTSTNESIYWKLRIPSSLKAGSYYGRNTFAAAPEDTCSTGVPY